MKATNQQMTSEQLDELMVVAVSMQRDAEKLDERPVAVFAYAIQLVLAELQNTRQQLAAVVAENAGLKQACGGDGSYRDCPACTHSEYIEAPDTPATDAYLAEVRASAIPDGWKLVPEQMYLEADDIELICSQCGNGDKKYGEFNDGIFWVGELSDSAGVIKYGLNVADANYPEEGSITVFEFDAPQFAAQLRQGAEHE